MIPATDWAARKIVNREHLSNDNRLDSGCVYCGGAPSTQEHAPSKVFLDPPYPKNLPTVWACVECNNGYSKDETFLAALIECVQCGTTDPELLGRSKIRNVLLEAPLLRALIASNLSAVGDTIVTSLDQKRVDSVLVKLTVGHVKFETGVNAGLSDARVSATPLCLMDEGQRFEFDAGDFGALVGWPEVGSRAFEGTAAGLGSCWWNVQDGRYRYRVPSEQEVRIVLGDYLGAAISFGGWPGL